MLVKQPRHYCGIGNLKCEEKSGIEVKISESSYRVNTYSNGSRKKMTSIIKTGLSDLKIKISFWIFNVLNI